MELNIKQKEVINYIHQGNNVFITGGAGTGKSVCLVQALRLFDEDSVQVLCPTGISALNVGGKTIHHFFSWNPSDVSEPLSDAKKEFIYGTHKKIYKRNLLKKRCIIFDEISMIPGHLFEYIEWTLSRFFYDLADQEYKKKKSISFFTQNKEILVKPEPKPWGSCQIIIFGDYYQLSPISKETLYCFQTEQWKLLNLVSIELTEGMRQTSNEFFIRLQRLRKGKQTRDDLTWLRTKIGRNIKGLYLVGTNKKCDEINRFFMNELEGDTSISSREINTTNPDIKSILDNCYANVIPEILELRKGCKVIIIKNIYTEIDERKILIACNGDRGTLYEIDNTYNILTIRLDRTKEKIHVKKIKWAIDDPNDSDKKEAYYYKQYPIRLAWAITIHKSQGMTLDNVNIDTSDLFGNSSFYVACSRVRNEDFNISDAPTSWEWNNKSIYKPSNIVKELNIESLI